MDYQLTLYRIDTMIWYNAYSTKCGFLFGPIQNNEQMIIFVIRVESAYTDMNLPLYVDVRYL